MVRRTKWISWYLRIIWQHLLLLTDSINKDLLDDHEIDVIYNPVENLKIYAFMRMR